MTGATFEFNQIEENEKQPKKGGIMKWLNKLLKKTPEKFKPVTMIIPADTDDLFVDVEMLQGYRKISPICEHLYGGLVLGFGKNVFVFDVGSCDFLTWARYVGEEPRMEVCEVEEA